MKLIDHINQSLGLHEGQERSDIAILMHDYLENHLTSEGSQYSDIEEMFQDLYAKLEDVTHDDIGSSNELRNFISEPLGLNFDDKGGVVDAVLSDLGSSGNLQNYIPTVNESSLLDLSGTGQSTLAGWYLEKRAMKLWLDDNPGKTERDWKYIGVDVSDEYTKKAGGKQGKYLGKGASEWTTESDDDVDYKDMRAGEFAKAHGDQWRKKSAENEDAVAKMIAQALGDESRWDEMSAHELYSELESVDVEMADVVKMTAKLIHDVDLTESKAAK